MRNSLLCSTAMVLALGSLVAMRPAGAACTPMPTAMDDNITCTNPIADYNALGGDDRFAINNASVGATADTTLRGDEGDDTISLGGTSSVGFAAGGTLLGEAGNDTIVYEAQGANSGIGVLASGRAYVDGGEGDDSFLGTSFGNIGSEGSATLFGATGSDSYFFDHINIGVNGSATIGGGSGNDSFTLMRPNAAYGVNAMGDMTVEGGEGADEFSVTEIILGSNGAATLSGGLGDDRFQFDAGSGSVIGIAFGFQSQGKGVALGGAGADSFAFVDNVAGAGAPVIGYNGSGTVDMGDDDDTLLIVPSAFNNLIVGMLSGSDGTVLGGAGNDTVAGGRLTVAQVGEGFLYGGTGNDLVTLDQLQVGRLGLVGLDEGNDTLTTGGPGFPTIVRGTIHGGDDSDLMQFADFTGLGDETGAGIFGGTGDDSLSFVGQLQLALTDATSATLSGEAGDDSIAVEATFAAIGGLVAGSGSTALLLGDEGADRIELIGIRLSGLGGNTVDGGAGNDTITLASNAFGDAFIDGPVGAALLAGGEGNDSLALRDADVALTRGGAIDAGGGSDTVDLSNGARLAVFAGSTATLLGGSGFDRVLLDASTVAVAGWATIDLGGDDDRLEATNSTLADQLGARAILSGGAGNDTLDFDGSVLAANGEATLDGGDAADRVQFRGGTDVALGAMAVVSVDGGAGADFVQIQASTVAVAGRATIDLGADADRLEATNSTLAELAGAFLLGLGGAGDDTMDFAGSTLAKEGTLSLAGEAGNDTLRFDGSDLVATMTGQATLFGGEGDDLLRFSASDFALAGAAFGFGETGADRFLFLAGSTVATQAGVAASLFGGDGNDSTTLDGSTLGEGGQALIAGEGGDDSFIANAAAVGRQAGADGTLDGGSGADSFDLAASQLGQLAGGGGTLLGGGDADTFMLRMGSSVGAGGHGLVDAGSGNDSLTVDASRLGDAGDGTMIGGEGDDVVLFRALASVGAGAGTGTLLGGSGNDLLSFVNAGVGSNGRVLGEGGDDVATLAQGATVAAMAVVAGNEGNDRLRLEDSAVIAAGALLDGGTEDDTLELFGTGAGTLGDGTMLTSYERLQKTGTGSWTWNRTNAVFTSVMLDAGTFILGNQTLGGATTILAPATLSGTGTIAGTVANAGRITPGGEGAFGTLTFQGAYTGQAGALLSLDVMLGPDGSPADLLRITGTTAGTTTVNVTNQGGLGAESLGLGILVIEVGTAGGSTAEGHFVLDPETVFAGMFEYALRLQEDANWYLTTQFKEETADLSMAGAAAVAAWYAGLRSLDERLGELHGLLQDGDGQTAALGGSDAELAYRAAAEPRPASGWLRVGGQFDSFDESVGTPFTQQSWVGQAGFDGGFRDLVASDDLLLVGAFGSLTHAMADVDDSGTEIAIDGYGGGLYATWLWQGVYVDAVFRADVLDLDYSLPEIEVSTAQDGLALGLSLEAGYRVQLGGGFYLEPQAQLAFLDLSLDELDDVEDDLDVVFEDTTSLRGRIGLRAGGRVDVGRAMLLPYVEVSGVHEFLGESKATVADTGFVTDLGGSAVELGAGLAVTDGTGRISLYLDGDYVTGTAGQSVQVQGGFRLTW